jgi:PAS domain S-box-containing protein
MPAAKILIVEDEGLTAMELQRKLKLTGYDVPTFAFSGKEAIKKAEEIKPDLVLMDIFLKGKIDGIDAAEEIKKNMGIPIIFLTAHGDKNTQERAKGTEPFAYLLKPFDIDLLRQNIDQALYEHNIEKLGNSGANVLSIDVPQHDGGIFVTDSKGIIKFSNSEASIITKIPQEETIGKNITDLLKINSIPSMGTASEKEQRDLVSFFSGHNAPQSEDLSGMTWFEIDSGYFKAIKYVISPLHNEKMEFNGLSILFNEINLLKDLEISMGSIDNVSDQFPQETAIFDEKGNIIQANNLFLEFFNTESLKDLNINLFDNLGLNREVINLKDYGDINYESKFDPLKLNINPEISAEIEKGLYLRLNGNKIPPKSKKSSSGYLIHINKIKEPTVSEKIPKNKTESPISDYEFMINSIDDVFFAFDSEFYCIHWNAAAENLTGIGSENALGKSIYELFPELKGSLTEKLYVNAFKQQKHLSLIDQNKKSNKEFFEINAYPSKNGVSVLIKDVTNIKKSESDLKSEKNLLKSLLNLVDDLICVFYEDGSIFFADDLYKKYSSDSKNFIRMFSGNEKNTLVKYIGSLKTSKNLSNMKIRSSISSNTHINWNIGLLNNKNNENSLFWASGKVLKDSPEIEKTKGQPFSELKNDSISSTSSTSPSPSNSIKTQGKGQVNEFEKMANKVQEIEIREANLINKNKKLLENFDKKIKALENDKNELISKIKKFKNSEKELKSQLNIQMEINESLTADLDEDNFTSDVVSDSSKDNQSAEELKKSLMTYERQYKALLEENKGLRENKSQLRKQANKIKKEYLGMEKEFNGQIKSQKSQIMNLRKANNSLSKDYVALEKRSIAFKENLESKIAALEQEKKQEIEKSHHLEKQLKNIKKDLDESKG